MLREVLELSEKEYQTTLSKKELDFAEKEKLLKQKEEELLKKEKRLKKKSKKLKKSKEELESQSSSIAESNTTAPVEAKIVPTAPVSSTPPVVTKFDPIPTPTHAALPNCKFLDPYLLIL
jgi:hypothetical protein